MRKAICGALLAMAALFGSVAVAPEAAAYVTHVERAYIHSQWHSYEIAVDHHSNGVNVLNVNRYSLGFGRFEAHAIHEQAYDFKCWLVSPGEPHVGPQARIIWWATDNANSPTPDSMCNIGDSFGCPTHQVRYSNGGTQGWGPDGGTCPYPFPTGNLAYEPASVSLSPCACIYNQGAFQDAYYLR
jgi:hypothetical protein